MNSTVASKAENISTTEIDSPWLLRPYDAAKDEDALHYLLGVAYTRSRAGQRAGASRAGGSRSLEERMTGSTSSTVDVAKQRAFLDAHRPVWTWLLAHADVMLACDPERPEIIWAWLVTSAPNVVHAVGVKRSLLPEKGEAVNLAKDVVEDMLGARLKKHQVCTLEMPQLSTRGGDAIGIDRPREWSLDPTWLVTRIYAPTSATPEAA